MAEHSVQQASFAKKPEEQQDGVKMPQEIQRQTKRAPSVCLDKGMDCE
jgi:hypothetical protein